METKLCRDCNKNLPIAEFHYSQSGSKQRKSKCKDCQSAYFQEYKSRNKDQLQKKWRDASKRYHTTDKRRLRTLKKYNLTLDEYNSILKNQNNQCAICFRKMALVIDHDHVTGIVRGLLCHPCNIGIGNFEDDIKRMESAMKYIAG